jgi:hypothetical protein
METTKSTRHAKISGNFAENLILYWLSKNGFECAIVDHVGIDLIARNPVSNELMGISVKGRTRIPGKEYEGIFIRNTEFEKIRKACEAFGCIPYFALVRDAEAFGEIIFCILSMERLLQIYSLGKRVLNFIMTPPAIESYKRDTDIKVVEFSYRTHSWW